MAKVTSNWKITFDPAGSARVLLDFGDKIEGEPVWSLKKGVQTTPLDDAVAPFLRAAGNAVVTFTIKVFTDEALDATARQRIMESLISISALVKKPLRIQVDTITDRYWQFANCCISDHTPSREIESAKARLYKTYSITATGLVQVGP